MNTENLEQLSQFLQEEIYLIPEDREKVLQEIKATPKAKPIQNQIQAVENSTEVSSSMVEESFSQIEPDPIPVKGNFSKGILLVHEESELNSDLMDMLVKMINACGHSMSEIGLVSSESLENRTMDEFLALNAHIVLKFGRIKHLINALPAHPYEVFSEDETEYLFADSLSMIAEDKKLKRDLWQALQKLFKLTT
ncbi:hypothetical protein DFQ04_0943 [Algoriphagus boseongensis]|uniref:DNA polymerase III psi subunit n=1 Tax=Algoriphagus boseongensis TaxID=1442587 RepID=A0A4R6T8S5_9BACT|nr:hypothetical protein [Algoriphagus boseongensis]TDQ19126.1 hypothetical protein DFQ04_0943 [Algoriphagus boseongensis]